MEIEIHDHFTALGHPQRLAIFRLLMRRYPDRVPAGEISEVLGIKSSTLSPYLAALMGVSLVAQTRQGTSRLYSINMPTVQSVFGTLLNECCRGRADICPPPSSCCTIPIAQQKYNVLFICVGNSARSIFAETLLRDMAGDRFNAYSAGTRPQSELNPFAVQVLADKGHDVTPLRAKDVSAFAGKDAPLFDFVFTVCNQAANEECPTWDGQQVSGHWGIPDPVQMAGTDAEKALAFQHAYGSLKSRIHAFAALPVEDLDRIALQSAIDHIGLAAV